MATCIDPGYGTTNGVCAILTAINVHGITLGTCAEQYWIPAACPDVALEGAISLGAKIVKIATVNGATPSICVQRDSNGVAQSKQFMVVGVDCDIDEQSTLVAYQHVSIGPAVPGVADFQSFQSHMRLRGNGDLDTYGGSDAVGDVYGVFKLGRKTGRDGNIEYVNTCSLLANAADHYWYNLERPTNLVQSLMRLAPGAATLYFPAWTYVSDDGLKSNILPVDTAACSAAIKNVVPVSYTYNVDGNTYQGFTYSNLLAAYPSATTTVTLKTSIGPGGEDGSTPVESEVGAIRTNDILAMVVGALKDITARVEALEAP